MASCSLLLSLLILFQVEINSCLGKSLNFGTSEHFDGEFNSKESPNYHINALDIGQRPLKKFISLADECIANLKYEDEMRNLTGKNWKCKLFFEKTNNTTLLCNCFYQSECWENKKFYFSLNYNKYLEAKNMLRNLNRGADFQCENYLMHRTKKFWSCAISENIDSSNENDAYFCECLHEKICTYTRYVDLYSEFSN